MECHRCSYRSYQRPTRHCSVSRVSRGHTSNIRFISDTPARKCTDTNAYQSHMREKSSFSTGHRAMHTLCTANVNGVRHRVVSVLCAAKNQCFCDRAVHVHVRQYFKFCIRHRAVHAKLRRFDKAFLAPNHISPSKSGISCYSWLLDFLACYFVML